MYSVQIGGGRSISDATNRLPGSWLAERAAAPRVAASGHTLFMPGSKKDYEELVQGIKDGIVSRAQLKWNAHWLLETLKITLG